MFNWLRRFYRRNFCSLAKAEFLKLFDCHADMCKAVVLVESSPLAGIVTCYTWEQYHDRGRLIIREFDLKSRVDKIALEREAIPDEIEGVIRQLEGAMATLGDYDGKVKDGVHYSICWGWPSQMFEISINNPQVGSPPHMHFIKSVKCLSNSKPS